MLENTGQKTEIKQNAEKANNQRKTQQNETTLV